MKPASSPRALRPFAVPAYRALAAGLVLALLSDGMWVVALVWQVIALGGDPGQVSLMTGLAAAGMVVSTLGGGVLADRVPQRAILIGLELTKVLVFASVGLASIAGMLTAVHLAGAALVGGVITGMYYPAYSALLPRILPASRLQAANGIEGLLRPVLFQAAGPMFAGLVIGAAAPGHAIVLAGAAALASAACYLWIGPAAKPRREATTAHPVRAVITDLAEGFAYMRRTPWLWATLFFACLLVLATMGPFEVLVPFALRDQVGGDASDHALVLAGFGAGAAIGALLLASIPMPGRYLSLMFGLWGCSAVPLVVMGFADRVWLFVLAAFLFGLLLDGPMVLWGTLLQRRVPAELLGRVAALDFFVSVALAPVSMALVAPVADAIGYSATFLFAGLIPVPCAVMFYLAARLWRDEAENPITDVDEEPVDVSGMH